jgi:hypothetical protein
VNVVARGGRITMKCKCGHDYYSHVYNDWECGVCECSWYIPETKKEEQAE